MDMAGRQVAAESALKSMNTKRGAARLLVIASAIYVVGVVTWHIENRAELGLYTSARDVEQSLEAYYRGLGQYDPFGLADGVAERIFRRSWKHYAKAATITLGPVVGAWMLFYALAWAISGFKSSDQ